MSVSLGNYIPLGVFELRVVDHFELFDLTLRIVCDDDLHRVENCRYSYRAFIEVCTCCSLHEFDVVQGIECGVTDRVDEAQYRLW